MDPYHLSFMNTESASSLKTLFNYIRKIPGSGSGSKNRDNISNTNNDNNSFNWEIEYIQIINHNMDCQ